MRRGRVGLFSTEGFTQIRLHETDIRSFQDPKRETASHAKTRPVLALRSEAHAVRQEKHNDTVATVHSAFYHDTRVQDGAPEACIG